MFKKIAVALSILSVAAAFGVATWAGGENGTPAGNSTVQPPKAGCDKCAKKDKPPVQPDTARCEKCAKLIKECDCKGEPCTTRDCTKCDKKRADCDKMAKDGKPCPSDCATKTKTATN